MNKPSKRNQYYGLRLISLIYKALCLLVGVISVGALGTILVNVTQHNLGINDWLPGTLAILIGGGLLALTFYVIAQVVEVQLEINGKMNRVLKEIHEDIPAAFQSLENANKQMSTEIANMTTELQNQTRILRLTASANQPQPPQPTPQQQPTPTAMPTRKIP